MYYVVTLNANERHIFTLFIDNKKLCIQYSIFCHIHQSNRLVSIITNHRSVFDPHQTQLRFIKSAIDDDQQDHDFARTEVIKDSTTEPEHRLSLYKNARRGRIKCKQIHDYSHNVGTVVLQL